jgi:uncharacterized damage-inducible protein DinB
MKRSSLLFVFALLLIAQTGFAQSKPEDFRNEFVDHFDRSTRKLVALSREIPAGFYTWSPGEGVMSIGRVYAHIARYNYLYLEESLGIEAPPGVDWPNFETITDKAMVIELLGQSIEHVRKSVNDMTEEDVTRPTMLYGRSVAGWAVLFQLLAHMNEHLGQSIAYARMNDIVPPWSR